MSAPKQIHIGMRGNIICHVEKEASRNTEHVYRLVGELGLITKLLNATEPDSLKCDKLALVRAKFKQLIRMTDFEYIDVNEVAVECAETLDQAIAIIDKEQS